MGRLFGASRSLMGCKVTTAGIATGSFGPGRMAIFAARKVSSSTLEALVYQMPLGLIFRRVVIWHERREHTFNELGDLKRDPNELLWRFCRPYRKSLAAEVEV